jgi:hypothetical protein
MPVSFSQKSCVLQKFLLEAGIPAATMSYMLLLLRALISYVWALNKASPTRMNATCLTELRRMLMGDGVLDLLIG